MKKKRIQECEGSERAFVFHHFPLPLERMQKKMPDFYGYELESLRACQR